MKLAELDKLQTLPPDMDQRDIELWHQRALWGVGSSGEFYSDVALEASIRNGAGVTAGVTPGVLVANGQTGAMADRGGLATVAITQRSDITGLVGFGTITGTGTAASPYTINLANWYAPTAGPLFTWVDTDADYWIRINQSSMQIATAASNMMEVDIGNGDCGLIIERSTVIGNANMDSTHSLVKLTSGLVWCKTTLFPQMRGYGFTKDGANATLLFEDCQFDRSQAAWTNNQPVFINTVAGGSLTLRRVTFDHRAVNELLRPERNWAVTFDRVLWNSTQNTNCIQCIFTHNTLALEPWTSGFTVTDSRFYTGSIAALGAFIGTTNGTNAQAMQNWTWTHSEIIAPGTSLAGAFLITLGLPGNADPEHSKNILFSWCRFARPQAGATHIVAGNEVLMFFSVSDTVVEYCWVDACGEDAYEHTQPLRGCVVRYSGGGDIAGSYVGGNMVDYYGGGSVFTLGTACEVHHIFGACHSDAVVVDSCRNIAIHHIDVDNVVGGFVQAPPAANVRLRAAGAQPLNGCVVTTPLAHPSISFNGKPCELTYPDAGVAAACAGAGAGTVSWRKWTGNNFVTRGGADGIIAA